MKKALSLLMLAISLPTLACDSGEFDRVREAALNRRECLSKYIGVTLAIGMGAGKETVYFQERIGAEINALVSESELQELTIKQIEKLGTLACKNLPYSSFHRQFCIDAATSFKSSPFIVKEVYCSTQANIKNNLCR